MHANLKAFGWKRAALVFAAFTLAIFAYHRAATGDFIFDDNVRIAEVVFTPKGVHFEPLPAFREGIGEVMRTVLPDRPLLMLTIWANYAIGGGEAIGYKLTNIALHFLTALLLFFFLLRYLRYRGLQDQPLLAGALALCFAVHPLHNQAVTIVIQRGVLLSAIFALLSLIAALSHLERPQRSRLLASVFFFLCGILCKPNILILPPLLLLLAGPGRIRAALRIATPMLVLCLLPSVFFLFFRDNFYEQSESKAEWLNYGLVQSKVIFHYLRQIFVPFGFNANYPIDRVATLAEVWPYCLAHIVLIASAARYAYRGSVAAAAMLAFYAALAPESSFFPIPHVVFDHRMYFPSMFLCLAAAAALAKRPAWAKPATVVFALLSIPLAMLTHARNLEIEHYMGWARSTALRYKHDHITNINVLNAEWALGDLDTGRADSQLFHELYPGILEYTYFARLFTERTDEALRSGLLSPAEASMLTPTTRIAIAYYLLNKHEEEAKAGGDRIRSMEEVHILLAALSPDFGSIRFQRYRETYFRNMKDLHIAYLGLAEKNLLAPHQREIWISILSAWERLTPAGSPRPWREGVPELTLYFLSRVL